MIKNNSFKKSLKVDTNEKIKLDAYTIMEIGKRGERKGFNSDTIKRIREFVQDFTTLFDKSYYGNESKLLDKIFNNLNGDIKYKTMEEMDGEGEYDTKRGLMQITVGSFDSIRQICFHEFIHCITRYKREDGMYVDGMQITYMEENNLNEGITTLIEEFKVLSEYYANVEEVKKQVKEDYFHKTTGYQFETVCARKLYNILGDEFLITYIRRPDKIKELLLTNSKFKDEDYIEFIRNIAAISKVCEEELITNIKGAYDIKECKSIDEMLDVLKECVEKNPEVETEKERQPYFSDFDLDDEFFEKVNETIAWKYLTGEKKIELEKILNKCKEIEGR